MKYFFAILLSCGTAFSLCTGANPIWTSTPDRTSVAACVASAADGTTINILTGAANWSGNKIQISGKSLKIVGAGITNTLLTSAGFTLTGSASDISGIFFNWTSNGYTFLIEGSIGWRIHHNKIIYNAASDMLLAYGQNNGAGNSPVEGLFDNNIDTYGRIIHYGDNNNDTTGNNRWAEPLGWGTSHYLYIEDNIISWPQGSSGGYLNHLDGNYGCRYVERFNTILNGRTEAHALQGANQRGCRSWEIYYNTLTNNADPSYRQYFIRGGTGLIFHEHADGNAMNNIISMDNARSSEFSDAAQLGPFGFCGCNDSSCLSYAHHYPDATNPSGADYRCRDQIGASTDDYEWASNFPSGSVPPQAFEPAYIWKNTQPTGEIPVELNCPEGHGLMCTNQSDKHIVESRDYYTYRASFNGTVGIGEGLLSARPATCTIGVGYWATDQGEWNARQSGPDGQLYKCTATNVWSVYYKPYAYPHPLQGFVPAPTSPLTYSARTDNCVDGTQSDCIVGRLTGQVGAPLIFRNRLTDTLPFGSAPPIGVPANTAAFDPDFGAYMVIVTDTTVNTPTSSFNMSSTGEWDPFNKDHSLFIARGNGGPAFLYKIDKTILAAHACTPATPCLIKSQIRNGVPTDSTHLVQGGDWSFSRVDGETNVLNESDGGLTLNKLVIDTSGAPSTWTLTRTTSVDFTSDTPIPCAVLPADYALSWSGGFQAANDGSFTLGFGGGPPWPGATHAVLADGARNSYTFIWPTTNNAANNGFQAMSNGTTGSSQPNWTTTCNTEGQTCTDGTVPYRNIGKITGQNNGFDVVNYRPGVGCSRANSRLGKVYRGTGVSEPSGSWTTRDDIVCDRVNGGVAPCNLPDRFTLHATEQSYNSAYATLGPQGAGATSCLVPGACSCAPSNSVYRAAYNSGTAYIFKDLVHFNSSYYQANISSTNKQPDINPTEWSPADANCFVYIWKLSTLEFNPCIQINGAGRCSGHSDKGANQFYKGTQLTSHYFDLPSIGGNPNPGVVILPNPIGSADHHGSGRNEDSTNPDSVPFMFFTAEVPTASSRYDTAGYAEDVAIAPDGSQTMWRFNHNYNTGSSAEFPIQNGIGVVSQDGEVAAFGSDLLGTRGSRDVSGVACNNLRADDGWTANVPQAVGFKIFPTANNTTLDIFETTIAGSTNSTQPNWNTSCPNPGDTCVDGTATRTNRGPNNCRGDIVLVDIKSAAPAIDNSVSPAPAVGFFSMLFNRKLDWLLQPATHGVR